MVCRLLMTGALDQQLKDQAPYPTPGNMPLALLPDAAGHSNIGFLSGGKWVDDPERGTVLETVGRSQFTCSSPVPVISTKAPEIRPSHGGVVVQAERHDAATGAFRRGRSRLRSEHCPAKWAYFRRRLGDGPLARHLAALRTRSRPGRMAPRGS